MKRSYVFIVAAVGMAAFGSGCARQCKNARENVIEPTQQVLNYLLTNPSGEALNNEGCGTILAEMQNIPSGAQTIRQIAESRFSHSSSSCVRWESSVRYSCTGYRRGYPYYPVIEEVNLDEVLDPRDNRARPVGRRRGNPGPGPIVRHPRPIPHPVPQPYPYPHPRPPVVVVRPVCYPQTYTYCAQWSYDTNREPGYATAMELSRDLDVMYDQAQKMCNQARSGDTAGAYTTSQELLNLVQTEVRPEGERVYALACQ